MERVMERWSLRENSNINPCMRRIFTTVEECQNRVPKNGCLLVVVDD